MGRAGRARNIAAAAAYGSGGAAAAAGLIGALGYGLIRAEALIARRIVGDPFDDSPDDNGVYGAGPGEPYELVVLGDSLMAGLGADSPRETIGAIIATGVAALTGRRVRLTNVAVVGAESSGLGVQVGNALDLVPAPDAAVIVVGGNDVTHRAERSEAVHHLEVAVRCLRARGCGVVVGTCPDLGTVEPIAQPLSWLLRRWSRDLAAAQTVAVVEAGGRTVSLGDLLGEEFEASPRELFSIDRYHPSAAGYARVAAALLPSVCAAMGVFVGDAADRPPQRTRGEGIGPVSVAAGEAVKEPGTEVSATQIGGQGRGPRGRWAVFLRRRPEHVAEPDAEREDEPGQAERAGAHDPLAEGQSDDVDAERDLGDSGRRPVAPESSDR